MENGKNKDLIEVYMKWLEDIRSKNRQFLKEDYSNPYFTCIPDNWTDTDAIRILIVGEEAAGDWGRAKWGDNRINFDVFSNSSDERNIREMQDFCWKTLSTNVTELENKEYISSSGEKIVPWDDKNSSAFWNRINEIIKKIKNDKPNISLGWTNQDLVYHKKDQNYNKGKYKLTEADRTALHKVNCLNKVIETLEPQIVLHCGWYGSSIKSEFGEEFCESLGKKWDATEKIVIIEHPENSNIHHIFTYHPTYTTRYGKKKYGETYENNIITKIKDVLN